MRKICTSFLLFFTGVSATGQKPEDILARWSDLCPIEKAYLHIPRDAYIAGENIWFEAYMYSAFLPDTISTSLYVDLLDESSHIVSSNIFPIENSRSHGQIELPDILPGGRYFIRAYSPTMLNNNPAFIYKHRIFIFSKKNTVAKNSNREDSVVRLDFFPEGGNFINGLENVVAFKATDASGFPVAVSGSVKNEKGETIVDFASIHDGMGKFSMTPLENEKYVALLENGEGKLKYNLPESSEKGITFRLEGSENGKLYYLIQQQHDPDFQASYIVGQMQNMIVFNQPLSITPVRIVGVIETKGLTSGILQITVFNKDNIPLSKRLVFINNHEFVQNAKLLPDTTNLSQRGKNTFTISLKDTVRGSLSVSVTDPEYDVYPMRQENILSNLLLTSDLCGFINDPAYYFSGSNDSINNAIDLVMMTNGWRRFKWEELLHNHSLQKKYEDPGFINLKGAVKIYGTRKYLINSDLAYLITSEDSSSIMGSVKTDSTGNFKLDSMVLPGKSTIRFFDAHVRKNKIIDINFQPDSLTKIYPLPPLNTGQFGFPEKYGSISLAKESIFSEEYNLVVRGKGVMLPNVIVKARKKDALQELEDRYATGEFSMAAGRTIDLTSEKVYNPNIFEYLRARVPGFSVRQNAEGTYYVYYRNHMGFLGSMALFLDQMPAYPELVESIPVSEIAMIKIYEHFIGGSGNSPNGALAIYTKKGDDLSKYNRGDAKNRFIYHGYSIAKQFYSPDYSTYTTTLKSLDHRITIQWIPDILVNGINPKIPIVFFNNDRTRKFRIVVEGITTSGKMVCIEKIIDAEDAKK